VFGSDRRERRRFAGREEERMTRQLVSANRPWERIVGYSRAVRVGNVVEVSGTAAAGPDGEILAEGDVYGQAKEALRIIGQALREAGASFEDVVRTRVLLTDVSRWEEAGRAHGEVFSEIRPANITMAVAAFIDPSILVEIEATAIVEE
jgi:enamine deaminase RidA (YjgF/YER057c/UK114 family)